MDSHTILQLVEIVFAVTALAYGFFEHYKRQKMEKVLKTITRTYPGDVAKVEQSCKFAWKNVRYAHEQALKLPESQERNSVLNFLMLANGDTSAGQRLCVNLFSQLLSFQEAQFNTRIISHPEKETLDLVLLEEKNKSSK
jgi:hypothetical protein